MWKTKPLFYCLYVIKRDTWTTLEPIFGQQERRQKGNGSETDESGSEEDRDIHFIDETVRHLTVGKIKVNKGSDLKKLYQ